MDLKFPIRKKVFRKEYSWLDITFFWKLAIGFMFLTALVSLFFGRYIFVEINKAFVLSDDQSSSQIQTIKKESINQILQIFYTRADKSKQITNSPSPIIDPSL